MCVKKKKESSRVLQNLMKMENLAMQTEFRVPFCDG